MILNILIPPRIANILHHHGPDMMSQHKEVSAQQANAHTCAEPQHRITLERISNANGSQRKTGVGEDTRPPSQMEVLRPRREHGKNTNEEPPERQGPQEDGSDNRHGANHASIHEAVHIMVKVLGQTLCHSDERQRRERRRADAHEQTRTMFAARKSDGHESTDHVRVHHERHGHSQPLASKAGADDDDGPMSRLEGRDDGRDGAAEHDGEDG